MRWRSDVIAQLFAYAGGLMYDHPDTVKTFRGCAHHARMGATETSSPSLKTALEKLAISYEARADALEHAELNETRQAN